MNPFSGAAPSPSMRLLNPAEYAGATATLSHVPPGASLVGAARVAAGSSSSASGLPMPARHNALVPRRSSAAQSVLALSYVPPDLFLAAAAGVAASSSSSASTPSTTASRRKRMSLYIRPLSGIPRRYTPAAAAEATPYVAAHADSSTLSKSEYVVMGRLYSSKLSPLIAVPNLFIHAVKSLLLKTREMPTDEEASHGSVRGESDHLTSSGLVKSCLSLDSKSDYKSFSVAKNSFEIECEKLVRDLSFIPINDKIRSFLKMPVFLRSSDGVLSATSWTVKDLCLYRIGTFSTETSSEEPSLPFSGEDKTELVSGKKRQKKRDSNGVGSLINIAAKALLEISDVKRFKRND